MRILHVINSLDPQGGGMPEVVRQFSTALPEQSTALCLDEPTAPWLQNSPFPVVALGPSTGGYAYHPQLIPWLRQHAPEYDAVIAHGLWQHQTYATRAALRPLGRPYFVFPHGMLDPGLKKTYPIRHLKKALYWKLRESAVLRDARAVLFTCEEERQLARQTFRPYRCHEEIVSLGIQAPPGDPATQIEAFFQTFPQLRSQRLLLFLGRLHSKKGCDLLIKAFGKLLSNIKPTACTPDPSTIPLSNSASPHFSFSEFPLSAFHLIMAGPPSSEAYLRELQALAASTCPANTVSFPGMLTGDLKWGALRAAEAFVLPSHQENFGIAVVEALACGTPVLISNKVNIWREIEDDRAGLICDDDQFSVNSVMVRWTALSLTDLEAMQQATSRCFSKRFEIASAATNLMRTLNDTLR